MNAKLVLGLTAPTVVSPAHLGALILLFGVLVADGTAVRAAGLESLIESAEPRRIASGFEFTEGPAFSSRGQLLFSDIPASRIVELLPDGTERDFLRPSGRANGLLFDHRGNLFACQGGSRRVVRIDPADMSVTVIADKYDGKPFNSPNDLTLDGSGGVYFTDPHYGRQEERTQPVMGVYYVSRDGVVSRVINSLRQPNGIVTSPDGRHLFVANMADSEIHRYRIAGPGKLGEHQVFFKADPAVDGRGPDGMALDAKGNLYTAFRKLVVISHTGEIVGRVELPEKPSNCAFGGEGRKTLYVTARTSVYALNMKVPGAELPRHDDLSTHVVKAGALSLEVPTTWVYSQPTSPFRVAQFAIPGVKEDESAELVVFFFKGGGGTVEANLDRWVRQFEANGRQSRLTTGKCRQGSFFLADVTGTYNKPIGPPIRRQTRRTPGSKMLAAIVQTNMGNYFLKLTGPQKTTAAVAASFRHAFGVDLESEKDFELKRREP